MSVIGNGLSALLAAQRALQTTSNNIANANTEGYVRQRVDFVERPGTPLANFTVGQGVSVAGITRIYDQFLTGQLQSSTSSEQRQNVYSSYATRLDAVLGNPDTGITSALQRFFDQVEAVGRDPTSIAMRQQLILEGESLATRFAQLDGQVASLTTEVNGRLDQAVNEINTLARQLASLNDKIAAAVNGAPSDVLDQQDLLLRKLAGQIDISTTRQANGTVTVLVGSGQSLVLGSRANELATVADQYDASRLRLAVRSNDTLADISAKVGGGVVGGLLAFRTEVLDAARNDLGRLALGLTESFNAQHQQGTDLNGDAGEAFFATSPPLVTGLTGNSATAVVSAVVTDIGALTGRDYELRHDGTNWLLRDSVSGATIPTSGSGAAGDPLVGAGLSISITADAGDRFLIRPTAESADRLRVVLTDPATIAAAGTPAAAGSGDNANALALADVARLGLFGSGTQSLSHLGADIIAFVGAVAARSASELQIQQVLRAQSELDVESVSGVNLDEEAADMLRFQQAYMAASKVISVANDMFQTLLQSLAR